MAALGTARTCAAVALLVVAGSLFTPVRAVAPPPAPASMAAAPPAMIVTANADGTLDVARPGVNRTDLFDMIDRRYGVAGALDATRAVLARDHGIHLPDLHRASSLNSRTKTPMPVGIAVPQNGTGTTPAPAGDLNADGADDIVLYVFDDETELTTVRAIDGRDGTELWRRPPAAWVDGLAIPTKDVTGDGRNDLFRLQLSSPAFATKNWSCTSDGKECIESRDGTLRWTYGVVSGHDGADLWTEVVDGSFHWHRKETRSGTVAASSTETERVWRGVNDWLTFAPAADHNGDGADDVVVNVFSGVRREYASTSTDTVVFEKEASGKTFRATTQASVRSAGTGAPLWTRSTESSRALGLLQSAPQLVGTPTPDLVWEAEVRADQAHACQSYNVVVARTGTACTSEGDGRNSHVVSVIDGETLQDAWANIADGDSGWAAVGPDLSGDGVADVVRTTYREPVGPTTQFLSGTSGAELWRMNDYPLDVGTDVLVADFVYDGEQDAIVIAVERLQGATGAPLHAAALAINPTVEGANHVTYSVDTVEAGGVPGADVLVQGYEARVKNGRMEEAASHLVLDDVAGTRLADRRTDDAQLAHPFADIDGDGLTEALVHRYHYDGQHPYGDTEVVGMSGLADGDLRWGVPSNAYVSRGGNQDGVPGEEIVLAQFDDGLATVSSLAGHTGVQRWSFTV